jgi:tRNA threonylcarbamoyladenosine biosynthesis protein TsaB
MLGIDTSTSATAVALRLSDGSSREARDDPAAGAHPGHATELLGMCERLLSEATLSWAQLDRLAVGVGPGTFTGLRVGLATARGLAESLGVGLSAISSLRALADPAIDGPSSAEAVLAAIDARRGEIFVALYARPDGSELLAPCAIAPESAAEALARAGMTPGATVLAVGDGAVRYREQLLEAGLQVAPDPSALHLLRASAVCRLAALEPTGSADYRSVLPDYRRRPDAELAQAKPGAGA